MRQQPFPSRRQARVLTRGLGWFSIGLGLVQLLAARRVAGAVGLPGRSALVAACGVRGLVTGIGLLRGSQPAPWLWGRVAGDVLDTAVLGAGLAGPGRNRAALALGAVAGVAVVDLACARTLSRPQPVLPADDPRRSGWPLPPAQMRGAALQDFMPPRDMRIPEALRPWASGPVAAG